MPTRFTRRAANAAALVMMAFWALFIFSAELPSVRAHSPWAEDPYDVVIPFPALLVPLVAVVTFVRCQRWRGLAPGPPSDPALALCVWLLYVGILVISVVAGYTLIGQYLRLIRCERPANSVRSMFPRGWRIRDPAQPSQRI